MIYEYAASLVRVVDGDTVWLDVDLGFKIHVTLDFRLLGINAPEMVGSSRVEGLKSKEALEKMLSLGPLTIYTEKSDKYGRWLATIKVALPENKSLDVNQSMILEGYATPYNP
jgi:micrococcal nuclease